MLELHSWITIRETSAATEYEEENIEKIIEEIKVKSKELRWNRIEVKVLDGEFYLEASIYANRKTEEVVELFDFYEFVGRVAEGSYGIIYMLDDGDKEGLSNEFQVFTLARGKIKKYKDSYLSPFIPTVEDKE